MDRLVKIFLTLFAIVSFVGCDQTTKMIARRELEFSSPRVYLGGMVCFQYAENTGAFLGIGSDLPRNLRLALSLLLATIILTGFLLLLLKVENLPTIQLLAFSLVLAGGCGNIIDRLNNEGRVIDFLILEIGPFRSGILNIADILITTGLFILFYASTKEWRSAA